MNIFGFSVSRKERRASERKGFSVDVSSALSSLFGGRAVSAKGETVCFEENSAVVVAMRWTMDNVTSGEVVTQRYAGTRYETVAGHPLTKLLRRPSKSMTGEQLDQARAVSLILDGNSYVYKVRNGNGRVVELQYIPHYAIVPKANADGELAYYEYRTHRGTVKLDPADVIHTRRGVDPNDKLKGFSSLRGVIQEVASDNEATTYTLSILRNLGVTGLIISPKGDGYISEEQAELVKDKVKAATTGKNRGEPLVAGQGIDISTTGYSPEQMNLDRIRIIPEARILGAIGIPGMALNMTSGDDVRTFSNYGEARKSAYEDYLVPLWRALDSSAADSLLEDFGGDPDTMRVSRDLSDVPALAYGVSDRMIAEYAGGLRKRSEARQELGLPTDAGDDVYYLDAQAANLSDGQAKAAVKADILGKRTRRDLAEVA